MKKLLIPTAAVAMMLLAGCSSPAPAEKPTAPTEQTEAATEQPEAQQETPAGDSRENPLPFGSVVKHGGWTITVNSWEPNVNDRVAAAGDDMSMLEPGMQYALMNLTIAWDGEGTGDISIVDVSYIPTDDAGGVVSPSWAAYGTTPTDNKLAYAELTTGGEVTGDMLYSVTEGTTSGVFKISTPDTDGSVFMAAQ